MKPDLEQQAREQIEGEARALVANTLLGTTLREIKLLDRPWHSMTQEQQEGVIDRLGKVVDEQVRAAVHLIATANFPVIPIISESVAIKDVIKLTVKANRSDANRHLLFDSLGSPALLVLADVRQFFGGDKIVPDKDQHTLFDPT